MLGGVNHLTGANGGGGDVPDPLVIGEVKADILQGKECVLAGGPAEPSGVVKIQSSIEGYDIRTDAADTLRRPLKFRRTDNDPCTLLQFSDPNGSTDVVAHRDSIVTVECNPVRLVVQNSKTAGSLATLMCSSTLAPKFILKRDSTTVGTPLGDTLGEIVFQGKPSNTTVDRSGAAIYAVTEDDWQTNRYGASLEFRTNPTGETNPNALPLRMRIDGQGDVDVKNNLTVGGRTTTNTATIGGLNASSVWDTTSGVGGSAVFANEVVTITNTANNTKYFTQTSAFDGADGYSEISYLITGDPPDNTYLGFTDNLVANNGIIGFYGLRAPVGEYYENGVQYGSGPTFGVGDLIKFTVQGSVWSMFGNDVPIGPSRTILSGGPFYPCVITNGVGGVTTYSLNLISALNPVCFLLGETNHSLNRITEVADPILLQDAVTKSYMESATAWEYHRDEATRTGGGDGSIVLAQGEIKQMLNDGLASTSRVDQAIPGHTLFSGNLITPETDGDSYTFGMRAVVQNSSQTGSAAFRLNINGGAIFISLGTVAFTNTNLQAIDKTIAYFSGASFVGSGAILECSSLEGTTTITDIEFLLVRTHRGR